MHFMREKPILAVLCRDEMYTWKLTEFMNSKKGFPFEAAAFTDPERYLACALQQKVEVLLLGEELCGPGEDDALAASAGMLIILTGGGGDPCGEGAGRQISRYLSADRLIEQVLGACAMEGASGEAGAREGGRSEAGPLLAAKKNYELIGVCSPVGRCGKTGFALTLGEILAEEKRALYLNLERYSGLRQSNIMDLSGGDINDLIYYCRTDESSLVYRIGSLTRTFRNLDYIPPAASGDDVMQVDASEWEGILSAVTAAGEYEAVILELDASAQDMAGILGICSRVFVPVLDEGTSMAKISRFMEEMQQERSADITGKIKQIHVPQVKETLLGQDALRLLVRGRMGSFARKMIRAGEQTYSGRGDFAMGL